MTTLSTQVLGVFRRVPGVCETSAMSDEHRFFFGIRRQDGDLCWVSRHRLSRTWGVHLRSTNDAGRWALMLRPPGVLPVVRAWAGPGVSCAQRNTLYATMMNMWAAPRGPYYIGPAGTPDARDVFTVQTAVGRIAPSRPDGRFTFAGCVEPYPGCWTAERVLEAATGDLTALWPYLTEIADEPFTEKPHE